VIRGYNIISAFLLVRVAILCSLRYVYKPDPIIITDPTRVSISTLSLKINMPTNNEKSSLEYLKDATIEAFPTRTAETIA
tara:strand:+ start:293 stop:532 length:240 start_codon:yes stop_codon:yes gene_type:complete